MKSLPSVGLYIRITDDKGCRHYERVNRRNPQLSGGVYCLRFYDNGKRKWETVGIDINAALAARFKKECELRHQNTQETLSQPKPLPAAPKTLEQLRIAFIQDKKTTIKSDGTPLDPDSIRSCENETRYFLDTIKRNLPLR
jgi:hypothetical protein